MWLWDPENMSPAMGAKFETLAPLNLQAIGPWCGCLMADWPFIGTVDLVKRQVEGKARADLWGIVGAATAPLSLVLSDMRISGPLNDIGVSPLGPSAVAKTAVTATAKASVAQWVEA